MQEIHLTQTALIGSNTRRQGIVRAEARGETAASAAIMRKGTALEILETVVTRQRVDVCRQGVGPVVAVAVASHSKCSN